MTTVATSTADLSSPIPSPSTFSGNSDSDWSPLASILSIIALIGIPTLIYTFFFAIKCPPNPFRSRRWSTGRPVGEPSANFVHADAVTTKKYVNEEPGGGECPVCLSVFVDGEEVRQLKACNHAFHGGCIDKWLCSHSSCPVCRAAISVKRVGRPVMDRDGDNDFRQGMPDSADLV